MRCKKCKALIILYLYGELKDGDRAAFEEHVDGCPSCREELIYTKSVFEAVDETRPAEIPEGDWDRNWGIIRSALPDKSLRRKGVFGLPQWAFAGAAVVLIFLLGLLAGRTWFFPDAAPSLSRMREASVKEAFNLHLGDIKPLLIDYANFTGPENNGSTVLVDRDFLRGLLVQNILLKRILAEKHPEAARLLEDIELVLTELENLEPDDDRTPALIKELIQKREILFKMEILQKT
jgi:hypothetical protein